MKKSILYVTAFLVAMVTLFSSCEKEPEVLKLTGTTWVASLTGGILDNAKEGGDSSLRLVFLSEEAGQLVFGTPNGSNSSTIRVNFSYQIDGHKVKIVFATELASFFGTSDTSFEAKYNKTFKTLTLQLGVVPCVFKKIS